MMYSPAEGRVAVTIFVDGMVIVGDNDRSFPHHFIEDIYPVPFTRQQRDKRITGILAALFLALAAFKVKIRFHPLSDCRVPTEKAEDASAERMACSVQPEIL